MIIKRCLPVFMFVLTSFICASQQKAIFIIADGIPADVITKLNLPNLKAVAGKNGWATTSVGGEKSSYTETPTISAVGYNSILTSTWVNKHNVWDNDIAAPNYNYPTLFRLLKQQDSTKTVAIFSSWKDNRTKLVGDRLAATGNFKIDYIFDGLELDTIAYPHDKERSFMHRIDEAVVDNAVTTIRKNAPDLTWVYLEYTDNVGHLYGDSPQFYNAVSMMDLQVGRIWQAIQYREKNFGEHWQLIITTDHGRDSATGKDHGGQSDRERSGWMVTNAKDLNDYFKSGRATMVDILPTMAKFLDIKIPLAQKRELDGIPLTGPLSAIDLNATIRNDSLLLHWIPVNRNGMATIWLSSSNNFKTGGTDSYKKLATVAVKNGQAQLRLPPGSFDFYKVVLEMPENFLSKWITAAK